MPAESVKQRQAEGTRDAASEAERLQASEFGARLAQLRKAKGWSLSNLARRIGVSRQGLSNWERGRHVPPLDALLALREVFGIPLEELITGQKAPAAGLDRDQKFKALKHAAELLRLLR